MYRDNSTGRGWAVKCAQCGGGRRPWWRHAGRAGGGGWAAEAGILVTNGREQRCPWSPGDSEVDGDSIGMRTVASRHAEGAARGHTSNHCLCLFLPPASAGPGAPQLCAPAFFLQGLLQTVLEPSLLEVLVSCPPRKQVPENGDPGLSL